MTPVCVGRLFLHHVQPPFGILLNMHFKETFGTSAEHDACFFKKPLTLQGAPNFVGGLDEIPNSVLPHRSA